MNEQSEAELRDYDEPVAYDAEGKPLYARAEASDKASASPPIVHVSRSLDPEAMEIPLEIRKKHEQSVREFPELNLSDHEYVILTIHRHPIGLVVPIMMAMIFTAIIGAAIILLPEVLAALQLEAVSHIGAYGVAIIALLFIWSGTYALCWVYGANTFFLTNESVIENTRLTIFSNNMQSVGLGDVVDVSCRQAGIVEHLLNYGTLEVGTENDDNTYVFSKVRSPNAQAAKVRDAVEAFKNGRPFSVS